MRRKEDFIDRLHNADKFKAALAAARSEAERRMVKALVEEFVTSFAEVLAPLIDKAQTDPKFAQQLGRSISENSDVLSTSNSVISGSTD